MAISYYFQGQYAEAEKSCEHAVQLDPKYAGAYMVRGITRLKQKQFNGARTDLAKAVELAPDNALFHREFGIALFDSGQYKPAQEQFDFALRLNPKDPDSFIWRAKSAECLGEKEKAIADLNTAVELKPTYSEAYSQLARLYTQTGKPARAAEVLAQQKQFANSAEPPEDDTVLRALPQVAP